jgi:predicted RNA methylase
MGGEARSLLGGNKAMTTDPYTKMMLTLIAVVLVEISLLLNTFDGACGTKKLPCQVRIVGGSSTVSVENWPSEVDVNVQNSIDANVTNKSIDVEVVNWPSN